MAAPNDQKFFRLIADMEGCFPRLLGEPRAADGSVVDARTFIRGLSVHDQVGPFSIEVVSPGQELKFSFGVFDYIVVERSLADMLKEIAPTNIQTFPAQIEGKSGYVIMNVMTRISCIDEESTIGDKWKAEDGIPELIGRYRSFQKLAIDSSKVGKNKIFRIAGSEVFLVVTADVRLLLESNAGPGLEFIPL